MGQGRHKRDGTYVGVHAVSLARHRAVRAAAIDHWCGRGKGRQGLGAGQGRAGQDTARPGTRQGTE